MRRDVAERMSLVLIEQSAQLNALVRLIQSTSTTEEFRKYRRGVGKVMAEILLELLNPIYAEHPDLKPEGLGGPYRVDESTYASAEAIAPTPSEGSGEE